MAIKMTNQYIEHIDGTRQYTNVEEKEFYVYNSNFWSPVNGGMCCLWTVPNGTTSIKFEK